jgi:hypothetical protein
MNLSKRARKKITETELLLPQGTLNTFSAGGRILLNLFREKQRIMFGNLYTAPAALGDFCDSSGCLPGQIPLPGQKPHSILDKSADQTVQQV